MTALLMLVDGCRVGGVENAKNPHPLYLTSPAILGLPLCRMTFDNCVRDLTPAICDVPTSQRILGSFKPVSLWLRPAMSAYTIANLPRISREQLAGLVRAKSPSLAVIDVRDSDYIGGHILNCQNVPVHQHDYRMPELVRTLKDKDTVVFHCALSQQRGPSSALRYLREKERMEGTKGEEETKDGRGVEAAGQKVYVLEGGFVKWQEA